MSAFSRWLYTLIAGVSVAFFFLVAIYKTDHDRASAEAAEFQKNTREVYDRLYSAGLKQAESWMTPFRDAQVKLDRKGAVLDQMVRQIDVWGARQRMEPDQIEAIEARRKIVELREALFLYDSLASEKLKSFEIEKAKEKKLEYRKKLFHLLGE